MYAMLGHSPQDSRLPIVEVPIMYTANQIRIQGGRGGMCPPKRPQRGLRHCPSYMAIKQAVSVYYISINESKINHKC